MYQPIPRTDHDDEEDQSVELEELSHHHGHGHGAAHADTKERLDGRKPATIWLVIFFLINSIAFGFVVVPRMNLIVSLVCRHYIDPSSDAPPVVIGGMNPQCMTGEMSSKTALIQSYGTIISGVLSAVMSPLMGRLSDSIGRIKVLRVNLIGMMCSELVVIFIAGFPDVFDYKWLFLAYGLDGLCGSFAAAMSLSTAYISDCTEPDKRNVHIGRIHGAMFIGISVGPMLSGVIGGLTSAKIPLLVFYICFALRGVSLLYLQFIPESLPYPPDSVKFVKDYVSGSVSSFRIQDIGSRFASLHPGRWLDKLIPPTAGLPGYFRANLIVLIAINLIVAGGAMGPSDVLMLYPQLVFKWTNMENNLFMAVINAFRALVSVVALPLLVKVFRKPAGYGAPSDPSAPKGADSLDRSLLRTAILCDMAGFLGYAIAPNGILYTIGGALAAFGAIGLSTTEAAMSKHIDSSHVGLLLGGLGLVQGVVRIIAPGAINLVYSWSAQTIPSMAFLVVTGLLSSAVVLTFFIKVGSSGR